MLFMEAYRQSLRPFKEGYRMLYQLADVPKMPLDSSEKAIAKFVNKYQKNGYDIFIISDYYPSLRPDSLLIAMKSKLIDKFKKQMNRYDLRLIEVSDAADAIEWTYDIGVR